MKFSVVISGFIVATLFSSMGFSNSDSWEVGSTALYNDNGKTRPVIISRDLNSMGEVRVQWREETSKKSDYTRTFVELGRNVRPEALVLAVESTAFGSKKEYTLKAGMAVKGQNDVVYLVEEVFADGRLLLNRMAPGGLFDKGHSGFMGSGPIEVVSKDFVKAVEVRCSRTTAVCSGDNVRFKSNIQVEHCTEGKDYRVVQDVQNAFTEKYKKQCQLAADFYRVNKVFSDNTVATSPFSGVWRDAESFINISKSPSPASSSSPTVFKDKTTK